MFLTSERRCEEESENYKQTQPARIKGGTASTLALEPHISERPPDTEKDGGANTNMGNGSKIEFTRARRYAEAAKKTVRGEEANSCPSRLGSQSECSNRQQGSTWSSDYLQPQLNSVKKQE